MRNTYMVIITGFLIKENTVTKFQKHFKTFLHNFAMRKSNKDMDLISGDVTGNSTQRINLRINTNHRVLSILEVYCQIACNMKLIVAIITPSKQDKHVEQGLNSWAGRGFQSEPQVFGLNCDRFLTSFRIAFIASGKANVFLLSLSQATVGFYA